MDGFYGLPVRSPIWQILNGSRPCTLRKRSNTARLTVILRCEASVASVKVFLWWFVVGATMAFAVILVQGGIREVMQAQGSVWELKLVELLTTIMGGGLLGGCIALILDRIKKS
jgi:hypothetical protein